jgi:hypothetical protein
MSEPASLLDPFDLLRGLASRLEKRLEQAADRGVRSSGFTRAMHTGMGAALLARKLSGRLQARLFEALNLPARSDVLLLGEKLQALEDRIIALSTQIEQHGRAATPQRLPLARLSPPRTRQPPSKRANAPQTSATTPSPPVARRKAKRARA